MDSGNDYNVRTKVAFTLDFDGSGELNLLALPNIQRSFTEHVQRVFQEDDTLREYIDSDLSFQFHERHAELEYTFTCFDENEKEAESFSEYCVKSVRKNLEAFGCKLTKIHCTAEEADITWLNELENTLFGP